MHLLDPQAVELIAEVFGYGQGKYGAWNWKGGISYSRLFSAILRHLWAFWRGEDLDPETGKPHLAHAGCGIIMLLWHSMNRKDLDDRYRPSELPSTVLKVDSTSDDKHNAAGPYSVDPILNQAISDAVTEQHSFYGGGELTFNAKS